MKLIFESWQTYLKEVHAGDKSPGEVQSKYRASFNNRLVEEEVSPDQAIAKEGGALGFSKWEELTGMSRDELEKYAEDNDNIKIHKHGDIIDTDGLSEDIYPGFSARYSSKVRIEIDLTSATTSTVGLSTDLSTFNSSSNFSNPILVIGILSILLSYKN